ncbi:S-adenosyl-L-methionine-dependent methyltransferase [Geopyxis carbonaria]|nr:S-adenosyl-L-methionine-dependent methyltransferase [Geopyxis carbonaria]
MTPGYTNQAHAVEGPIEVADTDSSADSDYASSLASSTQSLTSSVIDYVYENGRRYHRHSEGKYTIPNDETEQDRLDLYHHIQLLILGGRLFVAQLNPGRLHNVLDCGTGTGIWALDFAETHRQAVVTGVDLSPIQPSWTYPNCKFEVDDLEMDWTFPPDHFDYIHSRALANSIRDWERYAAQAFAATKPGGQLELAEAEMAFRCDDDSAKGSFVEQYVNVFTSASRKAGITFPTDVSLKAAMEKAGYVDVTVYAFKQPFGAWPKDKKLRETGELQIANIETGLEAYAMAVFTRYEGWSQEKVRELCRNTVDEVRRRKVHSYSYIWHVVGRKPE